MGIGKIIYTIILFLLFLAALCYQNMSKLKLNKNEPLETCDAVITICCAVIPFDCPKYDFEFESMVISFQRLSIDAVNEMIISKE